MSDRRIARWWEGAYHDDPQAKIRREMLHSYAQFVRERSAHLREEVSFTRLHAEREREYSRYLRDEYERLRAEIGMRLGWNAPGATPAQPEQAPPQVIQIVPGAADPLADVVAIPADPSVPLPRHLPSRAPRRQPRMGIVASASPPATVVPAR